MEGVGAAFHHPRPLMHGLQKVGQAYLRAAVRDPELRAKLTPDYLLGCKRILFSNNYLQSLTQPNVEVHATGVDRDRRHDRRRRRRQRRPRSTRSSSAPASTSSTCRSPTSIRGADGRTLAEHWAGSPEAYLGTVVAGFPNAFIVLGPSLGTGHTSAFTIAEAQVATDRRRDQRPTRDRGWAALDVRPEVQTAYVDEVQAALVGTAYNRGQLPQLLHRRQRPQQLQLAVVDRRAGPPGQPLRPDRLRHHPP